MRNLAAYHLRNPEKVAAHRAVRAAIQRGDLVRGPCQTCGSKSTHAHHDDYSKPIDIICLCPKHHRARHAELETGVGGRPTNESIGVGASTVSAPAADIAAWKKAAKAAEQTLNGWIRSQLNAAARG